MSTSMDPHRNAPAGLRREQPHRILAAGFVSLLLMASVAGGCDPEEEAGFPAGIYEVTLQTGSSLEERPECLDQSLGILDIVALYDGLTHFKISAVDEFGEPVSQNNASYWGFSQCGSADCEQDPIGDDPLPLLGSPSIDDLSGTSEMLSFGFSEIDEWAECFRIVFTSHLYPDDKNESVRFEFINEMVFVEVDYDADNLDLLEEECFSTPPELPEEPCTRFEVLEGVRID